jgi:hypothetical protein
MPQEGKKLVQQLFGHVAYGQWPVLPYRFSWTISISDNVLRLWRWSTSGVIVTGPIYYQEDPTPIIQFARLIAAGPYSRLGLDVGVGMTFASVLTLRKAEIMHRAKQNIDCTIDTYLGAGSRSVSLNRWVEKARKAQIFVFNRNEVDSSVPSPTKARSILVISHPISSTVGIFCRATRRYLAIHESNANSDEEIEAKDIHILKTSWQNTRLQKLCFSRRSRIGVVIAPSLILQRFYPQGMFRLQSRSWGYSWETQQYRMTMSLLRAASKLCLITLRITLTSYHMSLAYCDRFSSKKWAAA